MGIRMKQVWEDDGVEFGVEIPGDHSSARSRKVSAMRGCRAMMLSCRLRLRIITCSAMHA